MASWESLPCAGSHSSQQTSPVWTYNLWHSSKPVQLLAFPTPMNSFLYPMFRKLLITFSKFQLASTRHIHCLLSANMRTQTNLAKIGNSDPFQRQSKYTRAKRLHLNMCSFTQLIAGTQWCWNTKQCRDCVANGRPQGAGSPSGVQMVSKHLEKTHPAFLQVPNLESSVWLEFQALALTVRGLSGSCNHHNRTWRAAHYLHLVSLKHSSNFLNLRSSPRSTFQQAGLQMRQRACLSPFKETSGHTDQTDHQTECTSKIAKELKAGLQFTSLCLPEKQTKHQVSLWMKTKRRQAVSSPLSKFSSHYYAGQKVIGCGFSLKEGTDGQNWLTPHKARS